MGSRLGSSRHRDTEKSPASLPPALLPLHSSFLRTKSHQRPWPPAKNTAATSPRRLRASGPILDSAVCPGGASLLQLYNERVGLIHPRGHLETTPPFQVLSPLERVTTGPGVTSQQLLPNFRACLQVLGAGCSAASWVAEARRPGAGSC